LARVGAEDLTRLEAHFRNAGVEPLLISDEEHPSGFLVTIVDPDGERSFLTDRGANLALSVGDLPPGLLANTDYLVISGYSFYADGPRSVALELIAQARSTGLRFAIDPASEGFLRECGVENFLDWTR